MFDKLDKALKGMVLLIALLVSIGSVHNVFGQWDGADWIQKGQYAETRSVSGSSFTGTAMWPSSRRRPDSVCFNNDGSTIWIGTTTANQDNTIHAKHENIRIGFPLLSSGTLTLGGSMTDQIAFTCDEGEAECQVRCLDGKTKRNE